MLDLSQADHDPRLMIFIEAFLKMINAEVLFLGRILVETLLVIPENSLVQFLSHILTPCKSGNLPACPLMSTKSKKDLQIVPP